VVLLLAAVPDVVSPRLIHSRTFAGSHELGLGQRLELEAEVVHVPWIQRCREDLVQSGKKVGK
jgi:hypothetical protein